MADGQVVHIIDDDQDVRQSMAFLLGAAGLAVRVHESATSFVDGLATVQDGCIVTDVRMPGMDGMELLRQLKAVGSQLPVVVMTGHGDISLAVQAMKSGAVDFIEKPFDDEMMLSAITSALARRRSEREEGSAVSEVHARLKLLTERERQVLDGLVAGKPNKIIAYDLGISARTVEIYRANVMSKMQAGSLSALVRMALKANLSG